MQQEEFGNWRNLIWSGKLFQKTALLDGCVFTYPADRTTLKWQWSGGPVSALVQLWLGLWGKCVHYITSYQMMHIFNVAFSSPWFPLPKQIFWKKLFKNVLDDSFKVSSYTVDSKNWTRPLCRHGHVVLKQPFSFYSFWDSFYLLQLISKHSYASHYVRC